VERSYIPIAPDTRAQTMRERYSQEHFQANGRKGGLAKWANKRAREAGL
jgi:hypothetical protein